MVWLAWVSGSLFCFGCTRGPFGGGAYVLRAKSVAKVRETPDVYKLVMQATGGRELPDNATGISLFKAEGIDGTYYLIFTTDETEMENFVESYTRKPLCKLASTPLESVLITFSKKNISLPKRAYSFLEPATRIENGRYFNESGCEMAVDYRATIRSSG